MNLLDHQSPPEQPSALRVEDAAKRPHRFRPVLWALFLAGAVVVVTGVTLTGRSPSFQGAETLLQRSGSDRAIIPVLKAAAEHALRTGVTHGLGSVSISPFAVTGGSPQPVHIGIHVADPTLLQSAPRPGVFSDVVWVMKVSNVSAQFDAGIQLIGHLNDQGADGDFIAQDNTYSATFSFSHLATGNHSFLLLAFLAGPTHSAGWESELISLTVLPPVDTSSWIPVSDTDNLFSIRVPLDMRISAIESPSDSDSLVKTVEYRLPDGNSLLMIDVYTASGWEQQLQSDFAIPVYLGTADKYVFAYWRPQATFGEGQDEELMNLVTAILGTFTHRH